MITSVICVVGIGVTLVFVEPRALDWLKLQLADVVVVSASAGRVAVSAVGDTLSGTAGRLSLWRAPLAMFALVAAVLVFLLRKL